MEQKSMTALVSAFARAYHAQNNPVKIFDDSVAGRLLSAGEYNQIASSMSAGVGFFNPAFAGTPEEALRWVVDNQLSPSPLGRAAFAESALKDAAQAGVRQYLILGAGYDTFAYRAPDWARALTVFELDQPATAADKRARLAAASIPIPQNAHFVAADFRDKSWPDALLCNPAFHRDQLCFCSLLGVAYYLSKQTFADLLMTLSALLPAGSRLVFDYPDELSYTDRAGARAKKQALLAGGAKERMLASYSFSEMEETLSACGFLPRTHLTPNDITARYFGAYNAANPSHPITAFDNVNYCLLEKA